MSVRAWFTFSYYLFPLEARSTSKCEHRLLAKSPQLSITSALGGAKGLNKASYHPFNVPMAFMLLLWKGWGWPGPSPTSFSGGCWETASPLWRFVRQTKTQAWSCSPALAGFWLTG